MCQKFLKTSLAVLFALSIGTHAPYTGDLSVWPGVSIEAYAAETAAAAPQPDQASNIVGFENQPLGQLPADMGRMHYLAATRDGSAIYPDYPEATAAYKWLTILQDVSATDIATVAKAAKPTIIARQMMIVTTAMYDAWAAYDEKAVGTRLGGTLRRPAAERNQKNQEEAIAYAIHGTMLYVFPPELKDMIDGEMREMGYDPSNESRDITTPAGIGNTVADALIEYHKTDGSNQEGNIPGGNGKPYSDYTGYVCKLQT
jgi:hypothetical protein